MKIIKFTFLVLFLSLSTGAMGQNLLNLNDLVREVGGDRENVELIVQRAVSQSPDQIADIIEVLIKAYPELTEQIVFGAIAGLPRPDRDKIYELIRRAIFTNPGMAPQAVAGALRATEGMGPEIERAAQVAMNEYLSNPAAPGKAVGGESQSGTPASSFEGTILSPSL